MRRVIPTDLALAAIATALGMAQPFAEAFAQTLAECRYEAERNVTLDASGAARLEIDARAGRLVVQGRRGLSEVRVRGRACAPNEILLDEIQLVDARNGDRIRIEARVPEDWRSNDGYPSLDLIIEVPLGLDTDIGDTSGAIELRDVGGVTIADDSGEIAAEDLTGSIRVTDGSGAMTLRRVHGDVEIDDGSGEVDIVGVEGSVEVSDGSGLISVRDVTGNVTVRRDGSGLIRVTDVGGDFRVERDGTGGVSYRNVAGTIRSPDGSF